MRTPTAALSFALVLFVLLVGLAGYFLWQGHRDAMDRGSERAEIAAHTVAAHFQWFVEASRQALRRIDDTIGFRPELLAPGAVADIDDAIASLPSNVHVRVFDASGTQVLSTQPQQGAVDVSNRDYFKDLREGETFVISPLLTDRLTGATSFVMARRIERAGSFVGAAVIVVPSTLMAEFWASLGLGPNSSASIVREDGLLVARYPPLQEALDLSDYALFTDYLRQGDSGSYNTEASPADGVARLVGYRRVEGAPLVAVASVATNAVLADFRSRLRRIGLGATPLLLCLGVLAAWIASLLRQDARRREELERALAENRLLFREVHHRVKNNLQTVSSVIQLQDMDAGAKRDLRARISAMAAVHEQIYSGESLRDIDAEKYLREIAEGVLAGYGSAVDLQLSIQPIALAPDQAMALGLITTELVSNSLKHNLKGPTGGRISISLAAQADGTARLDISDTGSSFDPTTPTKGLGLRLIRGFSHQLGGSHELQGANGLSFLLTFPIHSEERAKGDAPPMRQRNAAE